MKIDGIILSDDVPDWADGKNALVDGRLLLLLRKPPRLLYPRWWHRLGEWIGWNWLAHYKSLDKP